MQNRTGKVWFITPKSEELISSSTDYGKNQSLSDTEKSLDKSGPIDLSNFIDEKTKSLPDKIPEGFEIEHPKKNE